MKLFPNFTRHHLITRTNNNSNNNNNNNNDNDNDDDNDDDDNDNIANGLNPGVSVAEVIFRVK